METTKGRLCLGDAVFYEGKVYTVRILGHSGGLVLLRPPIGHEVWAKLDEVTTDLPAGGQTTEDKDDVFQTE